MNVKIPLSWRQVRIFTRDFTDQSYFDLLATFARPFAEKFPDTAFFFSRYRCEEGHDHSDTDMSQIPNEFWLDPGAGHKKRHWSLRFRFALQGDEENFLGGILTAERKRFWFSSFLDYGAVGGFGDGRFYPGTDANERLQRVDLIGTLLSTNARLVLHAMKHDGTKWSFEDNQHSESTDHHTTFASVLHMVNNPCGLQNGESIPVYITERELDGSPLKVWKI